MIRCRHLNQPPMDKCNTSFLPPGSQPLHTSSDAAPIDLEDDSAPPPVLQPAARHHHAPTNPLAATSTSHHRFQLPFVRRQQPQAPPALTYGSFTAQQPAPAPSVGTTGGYLHPPQASDNVFSVFHGSNNSNNNGSGNSHHSGGTQPPPQQAGQIVPQPPPAPAPPAAQSHGLRGFFGGAFGRRR